MLDQLTAGKAPARKSALSQTLGKDTLGGDFLGASQPARQHWGASGTAQEPPSPELLELTASLLPEKKPCAEARLASGSAAEGTKQSSSLPGAENTSVSPVSHALLLMDCDTPPVESL